MGIPDYQGCMRPCLEALDKLGCVTWRDVEVPVADLLGLSSQERGQLLASGRERILTNRVGWALTYLVQAGLVVRPKRGFVEITDAGRLALAEHPHRIDTKLLRTYPPFREFETRTRNRSAPLANEATEPASAGTPAELIESAVLEIRAALESEVLTRALALSPTGFEDLVVALLAKMGYGKAGSVERTSASGDAGVDGIISQDPLGLDRIYVQAKRYATNVPIDRPRIHEFAGALLGKQGDRGVYITTSRFTDGARAEADRINARIELIDGMRLAQLLVQYKVGVQVDHAVEFLRIDEDFFEAL